MCQIPRILFIFTIINNFLALKYSIFIWKHKPWFHVHSSPVVYVGITYKTFHIGCTVPQQNVGPRVWGLVRSSVFWYAEDTEVSKSQWTFQASEALLQRIWTLKSTRLGLNLGHYRFNPQKRHRTTTKRPNFLQNSHLALPKDVLCFFQRLYHKHLAVAHKMP